jgi:hypothetical protein
MFVSNLAAAGMIFRCSCAQHGDGLPFLSFDHWLPLEIHHRWKVLDQDGVAVWNLLGAMPPPLRQELLTEMHATPLEYSIDSDALSLIVLCFERAAGIGPDHLYPGSQPRVRRQMEWVVRAVGARSEALADFRSRSPAAAAIHRRRARVAHS